MVKRVHIRVDADLSDDFTSIFPELLKRTQRATTTLTGNIADQQELQGILNLLSAMDVDVIEVVTMPTDDEDG
ncbi:hypothetical protein [Brachybacterium saurashtrense]|uniref:hypothetical protein n=1 Tax=Brachybacterium saurashtrense TaxID=556288 RepID=UPI000F8D1A65|nr:hypothetical protein [Brachybacterium saurashtrense]